MAFRSRWRLFPRESRSLKSLIINYKGNTELSAKGGAGSKAIGEEPIFGRLSPTTYTQKYSRYLLVYVFIPFFYMPIYSTFLRTSSKNFRTVSSSGN